MFEVVNIKFPLLLKDARTRFVISLESLCQFLRSELCESRRGILVGKCGDVRQSNAFPSVQCFTCFLRKKTQYSSLFQT